MKKLFIVGLLVSSTAFAKKAAPPAPPVSQSVPAAAQAAPQPHELKVGVKGMVCAFCAQGIEKKFKSQPEVASVEVSLENKYVKLKFKEGKSLGKDKITEIINESGYEAVYGE